MSRATRGSTNPNGPSPIGSMARCGETVAEKHGERWFRQLHERVDLGHCAPRQHWGVHRVGLGQCLPRDGLARIPKQLSGRFGIVSDLRTEFLKSVEFLLAAKAMNGFNDQLAMFELQVAIEQMHFHC